MFYSLPFKLCPTVIMMLYFFRFISLKIIFAIPRTPSNPVKIKEIKAITVQNLNETRKISFHFNKLFKFIFSNLMINYLDLFETYHYSTINIYNEQLSVGLDKHTDEKYHHVNILNYVTRSCNL